MKIIQDPKESEKSDFLCLFELSDLCSDRRLLVNISQSIVSLLPGKSNQDAYVIAQRIFTESEMRVLLPLLDSPTCCQQAVLQASRSCAYEFLLQSLFFSDVSTSLQWGKLVQEQRDRLYRAQEQKAQRTEMRGVYNALFGLRPKLEQFGLTVRVHREGYYLALLM